MRFVDDHISAITEDLSCAFPIEVAWALDNGLRDKFLAVIFVQIFVVHKRLV